MYQHISVMLKEVLDCLQPVAGECFFDGTFGGGGYSCAISQLVGPQGKVIASDLDESAIANGYQKLKQEKIKNIEIVHRNFAELAEIAEERKILFDGIVFDLGLSSFQLSDEKRGFSFQGDRPLSMSFRAAFSEGEETENIINNYRLEDLTRIFRDYGEEKQAYRAARLIIDYRKKKKIKSTGDLLAALDPIMKRCGKINPATRIFQALRMETNQELKNLEKVLVILPRVLKIGGRVAFVSFHSGEDRLVKNFFRRESRDCICPNEMPICQCNHQASLRILTKKPLTPSWDEQNENPRSRSAKLRAAIRI